MMSLFLKRMPLKLLASVAALVLVGTTAQASYAILSTSGTDLGRIARAELPPHFEVAVDGAGTWPQQGFIVARFQNNQPVMKSADGSWKPWDGDLATLEFVNIMVNDGALRFAVETWPTPDVLAPCTFTVGYWAEDGLKFGYLTVDGL